MPIDFGGTVDSTILAVGYREIRVHLGLQPGRIRVPDSFRPQMRDDGSQVMFDAMGDAVLRMPPGGHYQPVTTDNPI